MRPLILTIAMAFAVSSSVGAATIHVPADYPTIQQAIDAAQYGDEVVLAPGVYRDSVTRQLAGASAHSVAFLKDGVSLRGSLGPLSTFVDGEDARHCLVGEGLDETTVVEGIALVNGRATGSGGNGKWGGGALFFSSALTIRNNRFENCTSGGSGTGGGGVLIHEGDGVRILSNFFYRCSSGQLGGGIEIFNSSQIDVLGNTFVENDGGDAGGGLLMNGMTGRVENNIFYRNTVVLHDPGHGCVGTGNAGVTGDCNVYWQNVVVVDVQRNDCGFGPGVGNNRLTDPLFCDPDFGNFYLRSNSPCAPGSPGGCGLIGALGVACGAVSVESESWGQIKGRYRTDH
jgi:hypothetical protein